MAFSLSCSNNFAHDSRQHSWWTGTREVVPGPGGSTCLSPVTCKGLRALRRQQVQHEHLSFLSEAVVYVARLGYVSLTHLSDGPARSLPAAIMWGFPGHAFIPCTSGVHLRASCCLQCCPLFAHKSGSLSCCVLKGPRSSPLALSITFADAVQS